MPAFVLGQSYRCSDFYGALAVHTDIDIEKVVLDRGDLGGGVENLFAVLGDKLHVGSDLRDSVNVAEGVAEVEVLVAVAVVSPVDEFAGVEMDIIFSITT